MISSIKDHPTSLLISDYLKDDLSKVSCVKVQAASLDTGKASVSESLRKVASLHYPLGNDGPEAAIVFVFTLITWLRYSPNISGWKMEIGPWFPAKFGVYV